MASENKDVPKLEHGMLKLVLDSSEDSKADLSSLMMGLLSKLPIEVRKSVSPNFAKEGDSEHTPSSPTTPVSDPSKENGDDSKSPMSSPFPSPIPYGDDVVIQPAWSIEAEFKKDWLSLAAVKRKEFKVGCLDLDRQKYPAKELFDYSVNDKGVVTLGSLEARKLFFDPVVFDDQKILKNGPIDLSEGYSSYERSIVRGTRFVALEMYERKKNLKAPCDFVFTRRALDILLQIPFGVQNAGVYLTVFDGQIFAFHKERESAMDPDSMTGINFENLITKPWDENTKAHGNDSRYCTFVQHTVESEGKKLNVLVSCEVDATNEDPTTIPREDDGSSTKALPNCVEIKCHKIDPLIRKATIIRNYICGCDRLLVGRKRGTKLLYVEEYSNLELMNKAFKGTRFLDVWFSLIILWLHSRIHAANLKEGEFCVIEPTTPWNHFKLQWVSLKVMPNFGATKYLIPDSFVSWRKELKQKTKESESVPKEKTSEAKTKTESAVPNPEESMFKLETEDKAEPKVKHVSNFTLNKHYRKSKQTAKSELKPESEYGGLFKNLDVKSLDWNTPPPSSSPSSSSPPEDHPDHLCQGKTLKGGFCKNKKKKGGYDYCHLHLPKSSLDSGDLTPSPKNRDLSASPVTQDLTAC